MFWSFIINNWEIITTVGVAIAWLFDIRKRKYETKSTQGDALDKIETSYSKFLIHHQEIMQDLQERLSEMEKVSDSSQKERDELKKKINSFEKQVEEDKKIISLLTEEIETYRQRIVELEKQIKK